MNNNITPRYEIFDHTADVGVRAYGATISEAFKNAACGMIDIIFHNSVPKVQAQGGYRIKLEGQDIEQLLVEWLNELLFIFTTEHIVISDYEIVVDEGSCSLEAEVSGEILSEDKLRGTVEIKAVTYHMLHVKQNAHWEVQVLFDI